VLAVLLLAPLVALCNWLARTARTRMAHTHWRRMRRAAVAPAEDSTRSAGPSDYDTAGATGPIDAPLSLARTEPVSPPGSPPGHAEAPPAAADAVPTEGTGPGTFRVENGEG